MLKKKVYEVNDYFKSEYIWKWVDMVLIIVFLIVIIFFLFLGW